MSRGNLSRLYGGYPPSPSLPDSYFRKRQYCITRKMLWKRSGTPDCNLLSFSPSQGKASFEEGHYLICGHVPHNVQFPQISPELLYLLAQPRASGPEVIIPIHQVWIKSRLSVLFSFKTQIDYRLGDGQFQICLTNIHPYHPRISPQWQKKQPSWISILYVTYHLVINPE